MLVVYGCPFLLMVQAIESVGLESRSSLGINWAKLTGWSKITSEYFMTTLPILLKYNSARPLLNDLKILGSRLRTLD